MRTNIDIDDNLMAAAMQGGQYKTKREAVEDGLRLIARRNHAREVPGSPRKRSRHGSAA